MANAIGTIKQRPITDEMQESYMDYAMSVIVSRALPDVRDGLKPVQRRILYSMHEMGLSQGARHRKSAAVVGDVLGKYHPHGDMAVYDALVRLAQDFSLRYPLVDGQGNFGSVDGDSAAAMRYTETRMTKIAGEMLRDIEKDTVEFRDNYDGTRQEPAVMPSAIPQLLLNGTMGIAVGMATNIPPHNLNEVVDALAYLIDRPKATLDDIFKYVQGPDFPTGGIIYNKKAIREAYGQGRGPIVIRGKAEIKERAAKSVAGGMYPVRSRARDKVASPEDRGAATSYGMYIEITEVPYQVNKAAFIEQIANLVREGKLEGVRDVRDESDKEGLRVIVELKKEAHPQKLLNNLYKFTELQRTFHLNMLALVEGLQPHVLSLKEVLENYLEHKSVVVRRRTEYDLARAKERAHILGGLKKALDSIDAVIQTIKRSKDRQDAHANLRKRFKFTEVQANAILDMRLQNLANLERKKIEDELKEKKRLIKEYMLLLKEPKLMRALIKQELLALKEAYGDARKTKVVASAAGQFTEEDLIPKEETIISVTRGGYVKRVAPSVYRIQRRGGKGIVGMETKNDDVVEHFLGASTHDRLLFFTSRGRVFQTLAYEIPRSTRTGRGKALVNFLELEQDESVTAIIPLDRESNGYKFLVMATKNGIIKKVSFDDFQNVRRSGLIAIHLRGDDALRWVGSSSGNDEIILVTRQGQSIRFKEKDIRPMGRTAGGVRALGLKPSDETVGMGIVSQEMKKNDLLIVTENGYGKRSALTLYKVQHRGGAGIKAAKLTAKTGTLVAARVLSQEEDELIVVSGKAQVIRIALKNVPRLGRTTQGVRLMRLSSGDSVVSAVTV